MFYISMMILSNVIVVKTFLFFQTQNKITKLNQSNCNEMKKQIKKLESDLTDLKILINEFLEKKQKQIENLESQKEIIKQKNINKKITNFNTILEETK
ncbi:hypothetical protein HGD80_03100 [Paulownia witches'-broom phytoplasma]|uniref:Uncharacterized protein n=1 Tax=Paulownia witches'-broom phytoplasma TaxID=39647 RepID=A0ABX8TMW6_9MOLU|nr:hypothetical protein [Paulownia witches'-broom phytoplasma]QYC30776.1 hypothetical protein HGD80_03100 [Paulownia witches'-broom phytoplasma]